MHFFCLQCFTLQNPQQQPFRKSSFRSSSAVGDVATEHPQVEIVRNPAEWKHVEAILAPALVPKPLVREEYPSGWRPQTPEASTLQYFVPRTKNHMIPVYLCTYFRGQRRLTKLRRIQGDIWLLEQELHKTIEKRIGKEIVTRVNEMTGQIWFKGDYVNIIKDFLMAKGL